MILSAALLLFATGSASAPPVHPESLVVRSLLEIRDARLDSALHHLESLLSARPDFRLARLIQGDLLAARARPLRNLGDVSDTGARVRGLREEAVVRLRRFLEPPPDNLVPSPILVLPPQVRHILVVEAATSRVWVFRNKEGGPAWVSDHYVTIGLQGPRKRREGDQRTPLGIYRVTGHIPDDRLDDYYGIGAWPLNYPNIWDRLQGRTGFGIWIHGTPKITYSRAPRQSNGCVVLVNPDIEHLWQILFEPDLPVISVDTLVWNTHSAQMARRNDMLAAIESWRTDWQSLDADRYLSHYAPDFRAPGQDSTEWAQRKRAIIAQRKFVKVRLDSLSVLIDEDDGIAESLFVQDYEADNLQNRIHKRLLWRRIDDRWRIVWEAASSVETVR